MNPVSGLYYSRIATQQAGYRMHMTSNLNPFGDLTANAQWINQIFHFNNY